MTCFSLPDPLTGQRLTVEVDGAQGRDIDPETGERIILAPKCPKCGGYAWSGADYIRAGRCAGCGYVPRTERMAEAAEVGWSPELYAAKKRKWGWK